MDENRFWIAAFVAGALLLSCASVRAQHIGNPGTHTKYGAEIEPHFVLQWDGPDYWGSDGVGVGLRASIPVVPDGPVPSINNSLAISFGLDWAHFGDDACRITGGPVYSCAANTFWFPIVVQWNFFFSDLISAFPELGLAIDHTRYDGAVWRQNGNLVFRSDNFSHTSADLVLWLGVRFHLSKDFALTIRIGTPSLLLGASFLL